MENIAGYRWKLSRAKRVWLLGKTPFWGSDKSTAQRLGQNPEQDDTLIYFSRAIVTVFSSLLSLSSILF
jgi:hypothetical protein